SNSRTPSLAVSASITEYPYCSQFERSSRRKAGSPSMIRTRGALASAWISSASTQCLHRIQASAQSSSPEKAESITPAKKLPQLAPGTFPGLAHAVAELAENQVPAAGVLHQLAIEAALELPEPVPGMGSV